MWVSTHSHPKVAATAKIKLKQLCCCFNTQPPEGGCVSKAVLFSRCCFSFNTQPPEGGCANSSQAAGLQKVFQHTATRRWLLSKLKPNSQFLGMFQHTATRRWLRSHYKKYHIQPLVSTHSHPKVAASLSLLANVMPPCFNTQPPEGGCDDVINKHYIDDVFQHTATRRWLPRYHLRDMHHLLFQHTATRRWLQKCGHNLQIDNLFQHTATRRWLLPI